MKYCLTITIFFANIFFAAAQDPENKAPLTEVWKPEVRVVTAGATDALPPSDAIVLFDGKNTSAWQTQDGGAIKWKIENGAMTITNGSGNIVTKQSFGDCQLHIEWRTPAEIKGDGQGRGNSGIIDGQI